MSCEKRTSRKCLSTFLVNQPHGELQTLQRGVHQHAFVRQGSVPPQMLMSNQINHPELFRFTLLLLGTIARQDVQS